MRRQRRELKMQAARKAAIEKLQEKREEKSREAARIAQEEIVSRYRLLCSSHMEVNRNVWLKICRMHDAQAPNFLPGILHPCSSI